MSDEWEIPDELEEPTGFPEANMAIKILSCEILGHDVRAAVGRFVTAQALYTTWFLEDVKGSEVDMRKLALLAEVPMEETRRVYEAWKEFQDVDGLDVSDAEQRAGRIATSRALEAALMRAADNLGRARDENWRAT